MVGQFCSGCIQPWMGSGFRRCNIGGQRGIVCTPPSLGRARCPAYCDTHSSGQCVKRSRRAPPARLFVGWFDTRRAQFSKWPFLVCFCGRGHTDLPGGGDRQIAIDPPLVANRPSPVDLGGWRLAGLLGGPLAKRRHRRLLFWGDRAGGINHAKELATNSKVRLGADRPYQVFREGWGER